MTPYEKAGTWAEIESLTKCELKHAVSIQDVNKTNIILNQIINMVNILKVNVGKK